MKDTESLKIRKGISKKPKISKPTKTKTVKMSISEDGQGKILKTDGSLRGSKESISFRGSIQSKNTPYNTEDSLKFSGFSSTKPNTQTTSDQTRALRSNPGSSEQDKSKKIAHAKRLLNNSKSQNLFEKNPIRTNSKNNRLKKMKNRLDRQRNLINEITSIKQQMSTRIPQKIQKRSTSRTNRRNTVLPKETGTQNPNKILASRSRSRTGNSNSKIPKTSTKKVGINKIAHHTSKLSRNNSSNNTKSLKTRSFMNSTATYYNKGNQYSGKSMSGNKPRVYPAKEQCNKDSIYTTKGKDSYTKIMKKRQSISLNKNKLGLKKQNRSKSRRSSNSRNVACKVIHRCGSVGHVSPMNSLRENTSTQNSRKNIRKGNAGNTTGSDRSTNKFMRSRKSHSTLAENNQGLNDVKESVHNHLAGKGIISSFAGIETITFNLSSKVKMLKETNFF